MRTPIKRNHLPGGLLALLCLLPLPALAATVAQKPEAALKEAFPQLQVDKVVPSDIKGLYEVSSGNNIFLYYPEKDYLFVGEVYAKGGRALIAEKKRELSEKMVAKLPLDKAVKIGSGKKTVIEFTDPDCPYCRKLSDYLKNRTDITRYVFFAPLAHPGAMPKIQFILNAEDKPKAYSEMMAGTGAVPANAVFPDVVKALAQEHMNLAKSVGVTGTPTLFIGGKQVVGADFQKIDQLLQDEQK